MKFLVRIGLVIVVIVAVVAVFNRYRSAGHCTVLGAGVAHADTETDCLHQDALSTSWAETQQRQMAAAGAPVTTCWPAGVHLLAWAGRGPLPGSEILAEVTARLAHRTDAALRR